MLSQWCEWDYEKKTRKRYQLDIQLFVLFAGSLTIEIALFRGEHKT